MKAAAGQFIIGEDDTILVTGASGFIGSRVVQALREYGFRRIRCLVRPSAAPEKTALLQNGDHAAGVELFVGDLLSKDDCLAAAKEAALVIHLAAGRGEKSIPDAFMNSVVTTRNLLEACSRQGDLRRFVNVSSFAVYTNRDKPRRNLLDESCPVEQHPEVRGDAYCFAKVRQDEMVREYGEKAGIPWVLVRPGAVYGPGNPGLTARVGIGTFGLFLHLGGSNPIPLTYVDNCAKAIVLAGLVPGIEGEIFNVLDDDLPTSGKLLRLYKKHVRHFRSLYVPKPVSYGLCWLWERYCSRTQNQLPPVFNRSRWACFWKKTAYSNEKLKTRLGWTPGISTSEGLRRHFEACRTGAAHA